VVAAEDTRAAKILLGHVDSLGSLTRPRKLISYFEATKPDVPTRSCTRLQAGQSVAVISEAGMPGVSDPAPT